MRPWLLILAAALQISAAPGLSPKAGETPLSVSPYALLANPAAYEGKLVRLMGVANLEDRRQALYANRDDSYAMRTPSAVWLDLPTSVVEGDGGQRYQLNWRDVVVEGRFTAGMVTGEDAYAGQLRKIQLFEVTPTRGERSARDPNDVWEPPAETPLIALLGNPRAYDGKRVVTVGYLNIEFEGNALYVGKPDFEHGINRVRVRVGDLLANKQTRSREESKLRRLSRRYAMITGTFHAPSPDYGEGFIEIDGLELAWSRAEYNWSRYGLMSRAHRIQSWLAHHAMTIGIAWAGAVIALAGVLWFKRRRR